MTTAVIDARIHGPAAGIDLLTIVSGLPLVVRQLRQVGRLRWAGARIVCADDASRARVEDALRRFATPGIRAQVLVDGAALTCAPDEITLSPLAVYAPEALAQAARLKDAPAPLAEVHDRASLRAAERCLERSIRKNVDLDGVVAFYFMRPLSRLMTRALLATRITPNQVTLVAMACGVAAAFTAAQGGYAAALAAALLFWAGAAIDCVDGELARLRVQGSKLGEWLDTIADDVSTLGLLCGIGVGLAHDGAGTIWRDLGVVGILIGGVTSSKLYADLHRLGLPIDTAQYPWFFGKPSEGVCADMERGLLARAIYLVSFLFRRDAFVTLISLLLVLNLRRTAMILLFGGAMVFALLLILHLLVTSVRRQRQASP